MSLNPLRNLPSVQDLLENPRLKALMDRISHSAVVATGRAVLDEVHREFQTAAADRTLPSVSDLAERIAGRLAERPTGTLRPVINATGVLLHPELGRPPLAEEAMAEMAVVGQNYSRLDGDTATKESARCHCEAATLLESLSGAEAGLVVNNTAGALVLALAALAPGREVIVSRGQLIDADGDCPLSELIAASGAVLCEVGAANKTTASDYASAINDRTGCLLVVQISCPAAGTQNANLAEVIEIGHRAKLPVIHNLGLGALVDLPPLGLGKELEVRQSIAAGADVVLFSGDKLLGGPQCGLVLGKRPLLEKMTRHPLKRALRISRVTLAGLTATLKIHAEPEKARFRMPILSLLGTSVENLRNRAERLAPQIAALRGIQTAEPVADVAYVTSDLAASQQLATWCIAIRPATMSAEELAAVLQAGTPAIVGKVKEGRLLVDLRSVFPRQDTQIIEALESLSADRSQTY